MRKRLLSWLLVLTMVVSLIPSTLVTTAFAADNTSAQASGQAGKTVEQVDNKWPGSLNSDITDVTITSTVTPGTTLYVKSGKTLIFHGNGYLAGASAGIPLVVVEDGGQLVLDDLIIQNNRVGENGAIYVKKGGLLDLGYNDQKERRAPSVTNNTYNGAAKNIVIADGARVRLNNAATKKIGISYDGAVAAPVPLLEGGRYALTNDDLQYVVADDSELGTTMELDTILLRYAKPQFLFLDTTVWMDIAAGGQPGYQVLNDWQAYDFEQAGAEVTKHASKDAGVTPTYLTDAAVGDIMKYDVIMLCAFYRNAYTGAYNDGYKHDLNDEEYQLLEKYINNGGRVILQCEDANPGNYFNTYINPIGSQIAQRLGAGFNITYRPGGNVVDIPDTFDMNVLDVPPLTDNLTKWRLGLASPIEILPGTKSRTIFKAKGTDGKYWSFAEDMQAGVRDDGQKWGNIMALSDANFWTQSGYNAVYGSIPGAITFAKNILGDSRSNRIYAALGYNPNDLQIDEQASTTTTTTNYETVSKALGKVRNDEYTTLLRDHDLTPVSNELLFEESTLKFKEGTKYAGTEVLAKSSGVYIDITNDGSLNLHSGTVTVTPKDKNYVLTMNGTMDDAGTQITGGYKITATGAYTLDADDEKTPILAENGGGAKLTIPKAGTTVTVAYSGGADGKLDGKTVIYTAKNDGDSFYLGCYTVTYNVEGNVTWTANDLAWDGHDFVTKMTPAEGYEAKGEKLAVVDQTSHDLGNYQMENGTKENDPDTGKTDTWGVFNSVKKLADGVTPKITIRQQYLHNNNVDRNGYSTVTVRDVRANIIIKTTGDAVQSARPNIYVVGVGKRAGYEDEQLWAYTTQRTTDDQNLTKDVEGWPWANWKAVSAKTAQGTQAKYEDKDNPIVNWTTQQIKDSSTAGGKLCPVELTKGDMVVVFEYEWDMVDVKINAKLGSSADPDNATDFPGYIPQYATLQRDVKGTIYAPNLSGYQPDQTSQEFTPTQTNGQYGPYEVTFYYTMAMGQVVYRAVDEADHELATWDGPRVMQGDAVSTDWKLAPDLAGYQVKQSNGTALDVDGQPATKYDGKQITVTWVYESKTRDVEIKMVEYTADGDHRGAELRTDTTSYAKSPVGFTLNLTAPAIPGYTVKGIENDNEVCASKSVFVDDTGTGKITVYFYYEVNTQDDAKITVQMWDKVNNAEIWSYTVPGQNGEKQLVRVPTVKGYVSDPSNKDTSIAPDQILNADWGKGTVRFLYSPNTVKVTVKLVDSTKTATDAGYELNTKVPNYTGSYTVVKGESIDIVAPDVYGYTLKDTTKSVYTVTVDKDETRTEIEEIIKYVPISNQMVNIKVTGTVDGGNDLYTYTLQVAAGSKEYTIDAKQNIPGYKLSGATVGSDNVFDQVKNDQLTVTVLDNAKGGTVLVTLTYKSTKTTVTVETKCDGTDLGHGYTVEKDLNQQTSVFAPSIPGYTATEQAKTFIPDGTAATATQTFEYTKNTGNVVLIAKAGGVELFRKDGGTKTKGDTINATDFMAPDVTYYQRTAAAPTITVNGQAFTTGGQYDGIGQIVISYEYQRKTQDVTIIKKNVATGAKIEEQQLTGLEVGKSHTFTDGSVTVPNNYEEVSARNPGSYFVEDKANQTVTFWYKNTSADQYTQITVNLICDRKVFQSYPVTAIKGQPTTILAPTWAGYERKAGTQASATVIPNGTPDNDKVEFEYTIKNPKTVEVVLKDNSNSTNPKLKAPANYISSYTLKMGDSVTIWAPAIDGYSLVSATLGDKASDNKQMVQAEYGKLADGTTTVTFAYMPVSQANFVTHTVRFMLGDKELYSYDKKVDKGTGNVVSYPADAVKSMIPGYTYSKTTYEINGQSVNASDVKDNANAVIIYHFKEDTAQITISFKDKNGDPLMKNGGAVPDQVLIGYRKGQKVEVSAPVLDDFALKTGEKLIQNVTLSSTESNNEISFKYEPLGHSYFFLKEKLTDGATKIIAVINAEENTTYNPNTNSNPLDLSAYGYRFTTDADKVGTDVSPEFKADGDGTVTTSSPLGNKVYTLYYVKGTRAVEFIPVNKDALDAEKLTLEEALKKTDFDTKYVIKSVTPVTPADARVGETYQAVAQSFNGWALQDDFSKLYPVENTTAPLKVYFLYAAKSTGDVTVHYHFGDATNPGKLLNEYTIKAVVGEKVSISAPSYLMDNKYHLRDGQTNPYVLEVTTNTKEVEFYYEANFVVVTAKTVVDGDTATTHETYEVIKDTTSGSGSTTLYPPEKAGYTLIGITATGTNLTNGGTDKLPTEYTNNQLALTGLTQNATVTYYYKTTKASEYQTELTVEYKYNGYDLAKAKKINANTGEANSIDIPAFDGYTASTYNFTDGSTVKVNGSGVNGTTVSVTPAEKTATLTITYTRPDGSVVLPGKDNVFASPKDKDNVTVTPDDVNKIPTDTGDGTGSVKVPDDTTATVTRPTDPDQPDKGKENITVPGGSVIKPDGTIVLPNPDGGEIGPNGKIPENLPSGYVAITYDSNNGSGDVKKEIGKKGELKVAGSLFTHPTNAKFEGWNDSGLGSGTAYAKDKTVDTSITLYAKWSANYKYLAKITYKPNGGTPDKDVLQNVGHDTDPNLKATLQSSSYQVSGWLFGGWNEEADGTGELRQPNDTWNLSDKDAKTLYAQWYKVNADGSITVPGKDGDPKNEATNATANGNGNVTPKLNPTRNNKGEIEVPKGGSVTLPDGSVIGMPDGGKLLPNGTVIINRPDKDGNGKTDDGTITIPGKTDPTKPDVTDKDGRPEADATVIELVYQINNGEDVPDVTVKVVKGDSVSILANPFTWTGYQFVNWMGTDNKVYAPDDNYVAGDHDLELHAQWSKQNTDGSIELPGKDGSMTTPKDNVLVTPDKPNGTVTKQPDGSAKVEGNSGTVNRPKDPAHLDQGKENIKVPEGTIVKPDGTIILPDNGGTINPGDKFPGATPTDYISVVYKANGGTGEDVIDLIKNGQPITAIKNPFTKNGENFSGWNTAENGINGTAYAEDAAITIPNNGKTITLYAQWNKATYTHSAKITYQANDGKTKEIEDTVGANDSTKFSINLRSNPFSVSGWDFGGWNTEANGTGTLKAANAVVEVEAGKDQTWFAQWYKVGANGSITVPGDGNPNTTGDNVTANGTGVTRDPDTGNISILAGNVVKGNETIALPNGGTLKPDGSLSINKPNGGGQIEVKPDGSTDDADVVVLTYEANNGTNDTRKVYATKDEAIAPLTADTFSYSGHAFLYWKSGDTIFKTNGTITPTDAMTLSAVWAKVNNGSIELPGKDGKLEGPGNEKDDNVTVTPDKPNGTLDGPKADGSVEVKGDEATVTRPDPQNPGKKEDIKVPEGTVVEPDGTIKLPDNTTINPDQRIPDDVTPTDYYVVTYEPGEGSGDVIRQIVEKDTDTTLLGADTFTAPNGKTFDGWLDELDSKHDADSQVAVTKNTTLTAKWKDGTPTPPAPKYSADIVFDPNTGDATATQTVTSADSATITRNLDVYTQHFTAPAGWTFMGWSTKQAASQSSSFYADGAEVTLKDKETLPLYAILYKLDADTKVITLPGKGGQPEGGDDVTVTPGAGADLTVDKGFIKAPAGSEIKQPANETPIKVIEGEVNVYPDGSVFVPKGSKVQLPDGSEIKGETTVDPDGNPDVDNTKPVQKPDGTIVLPGQNGVIGTGNDDITIAPAGPNKPAGRIESNGDVTITNPSGADVNLPGNTPEDIKVPNGTVIKPNGDMTLLYTIRYVDGSGTEIKTATVKPVQRGISETVEAATITGYTVSGEATKTASGEVSANLADYTITFTYTKNNTSGGGSSGGGGSSTVSSYTIKASAGNGGIISPSGNVSVKRGDDQTFSINPINGYRISDVIVDGKSVGAVSTYTFDSVKANHTIQVKFVKYNSIVADPEVTGVAGWLQTKEHNGYMGGYGNGLFGPNDNMTRAQAAQMFYNLLLNKNVDITVDFTDVPADAWYGNAVRTLASLGVIKGIGNDQFAPNRTITRAEFTVIAMRFANVSADVTNPFTDISTNDWFYSAVTSAVSYGWINGYGDGSFRPQATITRAEVVTIVNRMLNRTADRNFVDSNATAQFDDVPNTYWAYYNIMEATIAHDHSIDNDGVESWGKQK